MSNEPDWEDYLEYQPEPVVSRSAKYMRKWRQSNPERSRQLMIIHRHNQRARRYGCLGTFTWEEWQEVLRDFNFSCARCGEADSLKPLEIDHIVPLERKGENAKHNLQPLCSGCNKLKGTKTVAYPGFKGGGDEIGGTDESDFWNAYGTDYYRGGA
jgi:5-methylcytosine-specific restriction endonuclease McrA